MFDLTIDLEDRAGALADMGEALGRAGVSVEGGGAWVVGGRGVAHFLVKDGEQAKGALEAAGIRVGGQLGKLTRRMAEAGVNIEVLYSDHDNQLILVVDDVETGRAVSEGWTAETREALP